MESPWEITFGGVSVSLAIQDTVAMSHGLGIFASQVFVQVVSGEGCGSSSLCNQPNYSSRDTEYYDYGHGEAQDTYEPYGMSGNAVLLPGKGLHLVGNYLQCLSTVGICLWPASCFPVPLHTLSKSLRRTLRTPHGRIFMS